MNLFDFLYRGATVYVAAGQIYAEPRRDSICGPKDRIAQKPRAMQVCLRLPRRDSICGPKDRIAQKPRAMQVYLQLPRRDSICGPQGPNCAEAESNASLLAIASGATAYAAALSLAVMLAVDFSVICTAHAISFLIKKRDLVSLYP